MEWVSSLRGIPTLHLNAATVLLAHNHLTGDPHPSPQDVVLTKEPRELLSNLGIRLRGHYIFGGGELRAITAADYALGEAEPDGVVEFRSPSLMSDLAQIVAAYRRGARSFHLGAQWLTRPYRRASGQPDPSLVDGADPEEADPEDPPQHRF